MNLLDYILAIPACPSGGEAEAAAYIEAAARPFADECYKDTMGNLIVHKKVGGSRIMLSAYMDSVGFAATHIEKEGFVRIGVLGEVKLSAAVGAGVKFSNGVRGVVCLEDKADTKDIKASDLYIDIGAADGDEAKKLIYPGDLAVFSGDCFEQNGCVFGPPLGGRLSCAVALSVLSRIQSPKNDLYFAFTVQKELGQRGAKTAAFSIEPEAAFTIDITRSGDTPGGKKECALGSGVAIKIMDSSVICHPEAVKLLTEAASKENIKWQYDIAQTGSGDAGAIHLSRGGVKTGAACVPARNTHMPMEIINLKDAEAATDLLTAVLSGAL